jgi:hypothetical protein
VPPDSSTVAVSVADWPRSTAGGDSTTIGESVGLTVATAAEAVDALSGDVALSLTVAQ